MTYSEAAYQSSLVAQARRGNGRALAAFLNRFLKPQGIQVRVAASPPNRLRIFLYFHGSPSRWGDRRDGVALTKQARLAYLKTRPALVQAIASYLRSLNSQLIQEVRIVAQVVGSPQILWQQGITLHYSSQAAPPLSLNPRTAFPTPQREKRPHKGLKKRHPRSPIFRVLTTVSIAFGFLVGFWLTHRVIAGQNAPNSIAKMDTTALNTELSKEKVMGGFELLEQHLQSDRMVTVPKAFQGQIIRHIQPPNGDKVVALTFDDGPWPKSTLEILDILAQNQVKATFFMVGKYLKEHPELAKKVAESGHAIGNHTWSHKVATMKGEEAQEEVEKTAKLIEETIQVKTMLLRPPGGNLKGGLVEYGRRKNYAIIMWSIDSSDFRSSKSKLLKNVLENPKPGDIILLHDGGGDRSATVEALPEIIQTLRRDGYRFVTIPELLDLQSSLNGKPTLSDHNSQPMLDSNFQHNKPLI